jgi:hypothetical protein
MSSLKFVLLFVSFAVFANASSELESTNVMKARVESCGG